MLQTLFFKALSEYLHAVSKVVRKKLAVAQPTVMCEAFMYEEGPDLDEDEVEGHAAHLPKILADLPSGGIKDSSVVEVSDQSQQLSLSLILTHQVHQKYISTPSGICSGFHEQTHESLQVQVLGHLLEFKCLRLLQGCQKELRKSTLELRLSQTGCTQTSSYPA